MCDHCRPSMAELIFSKFYVLKWTIAFWNDSFLARLLCLKNLSYSLLVLKRNNRLPSRMFKLSGYNQTNIIKFLVTKLNKFQTIFEVLHASSPLYHNVPAISPHQQIYYQINFNFVSSTFSEKNSLSWIIKIDEPILYFWSFSTITSSQIFLDFNFKSTATQMQNHCCGRLNNNAT